MVLLVRIEEKSLEISGIADHDLVGNLVGLLKIGSVVLGDRVDRSTCKGSGLGCKETCCGKSDLVVAGVETLHENKLELCLASVLVHVELVAA